MRTDRRANGRTIYLFNQNTFAFRLFRRTARHTYIQPRRIRIRLATTDKKHRPYSPSGAHRFNDYYFMCCYYYYLKLVLLLLPHQRSYNDSQATEALTAHVVGCSTQAHSIQHIH